MAEVVLFVHAELPATKVAEAVALADRAGLVLARAEHMDRPGDTPAGVSWRAVYFTTQDRSLPNAQAVAGLLESLRVL